MFEAPAKIFDLMTLKRQGSSIPVVVVVIMLTGLKSLPRGWKLQRFAYLCVLAFLGCVGV